MTTRAHAIPWHIVTITTKSARPELCIERTANTLTATVQHVCVDHCRADLLVSKKFLHGTNVRSGFKQVRRETVAKRVTTSRLVYT